MDADGSGVDLHMHTVGVEAGALTAGRTALGYDLVAHFQERLLTFHHVGTGSGRVNEADAPATVCGRALVGALICGDQPSADLVDAVLGVDVDLFEAIEGSHGALSHTPAADPGLVDNRLSGSSSALSSLETSLSEVGSIDTDELLTPSGSDDSLSAGSLPSEGRKSSPPGWVEAGVARLDLIRARVDDLVRVRDWQANAGARMCLGLVQAVVDLAGSDGWLDADSQSLLAQAGAQAAVHRRLLPLEAAVRQLSAGGDRNPHTVGARNRVLTDIVHALVHSGDAALSQATTEAGRQLCHLAAASDAWEVVALLVGQGISVTVADPSGNRPTLLHHAAMAGQTNLVQSLLSRGASVDRTDARGRNALEFALARCCRVGDVGGSDKDEILWQLLAASANRLGALQAAARVGWWDGVLALLESGHERSGLCPIATLNNAPASEVCGLVLCLPAG